MRRCVSTRLATPRPVIPIAPRIPIKNLQDSASWISFASSNEHMILLAPTTFSPFVSKTTNTTLSWHRRTKASGSAYSHTYLSCDHLHPPPRSHPTRTDIDVAPEGAIEHTLPSTSHAHETPEDPLQSYTFLSCHLPHLLHRLPLARIGADTAPRPSSGANEHTRPAYLPSPPFAHDSSYGTDNTDSEPLATRQVAVSLTLRAAQYVLLSPMSLRPQRHVR